MRYNFFGIFFSILLTSLSAVLLVTPSSTSSQALTWLPESHTDSGELLVIRGWPQQMSILINTGRLQAHSGEFLDFGDWSLSKSPANSISVYKTEKMIASDLCLGKFEQCRITFHASSGQLRDDFGTTFKVERINFPVVSKLEIPVTSPIAIQEVNLTLRASEYFNGNRTHIVLIILGLYLAFLAGRVLVRFRRGSTTSIFFKAFPLLEFCIVFSVLLISSILLPALPDDGWVITRVDLFGGRGYFGNYFTNLDAPMPQGFFTEFLLSLLPSYFLSLLSYRVLVALLLTLSWVIIKKFLLSHVWALSRGQEIFVLSMFLISSISYLVTIRSELWIFFFSVGMYVALLGLSTKFQRWSFFAASFFSALGLFTHQTGVTLVAPLIVFFYFSIKNRFISFRNLAYSLHGFILALTLNFSGISLMTTLEGLADFSMQAGYRNNELFRWNQIFSFTSSPRVLVVLLIFLYVFLTLLLFVSHSRSIKSDERILIAAAVLSPFTLFFTSSKWVWHFGALTLPFVILSAFVIVKISTKPFELLFFAFFTTALFSLLSLRYSNTWGVLDFGLVSTQTLKSLLHSELFLCLALVFFTFTGFSLARSRFKNTDKIGVLLSLPITSVLVLNLGLMAMEMKKPVPIEYSLKENWSPAIQNVNSVLGRNDCGLLGHMRTVRFFTPLPEKGVSVNFSGIPIESNYDVLDFQTFENISLPAKFKQSKGSIAPGVKFYISRSKELGMWIFQNSEKTEKVRVLFLDIDGSILRERILKSWQQGVWNWVPFAAPSASTQLRIMQPTFEDLYSRITKPGNFTSLSKSALEGNVEGFISPYVQPYFDCIKPVDPSRGFLENGRLLIPGLYFFNNANYAQIGCWKEKSFCVYSKEIDLVGKLTIS